jgi:hypothetical protein
MTRGVIIFAHNNSLIQYSELAKVAGFLANRHLNLPVSVITDTETVIDFSDTESKSIFDKIIVIDKPTQYNPRYIYNQRITDFLNGSRSQIWNLTPYDHTLMIDSDFLIFSDRLNQYWDLDLDFLICGAMLDPVPSRIGKADINISDIAPSLRWATNMMFKKSQFSKTLFNLVDHIRENYSYYSDIYSFDDSQYRNDVAFSIAEHMVHGFIQPKICLPPCYMTSTSDEILNVGNNSLSIKINDAQKTMISTFENTDVHVMNKLEIIKFKKELMR